MQVILCSDEASIAKSNTAMFYDTSPGKIEDMYRKVAQKFAWPILIVGISNIFFNSLQIQVLRKLKKLQNISFKLVMLLSVSDLCVGLNIMVSLALIRLAPADWETEMFVAISVTAYLFVMFSFCMIIIISLDRYIHMKYLTKYSVIMTPKRVKIMVAFAALTSISLDALVASGRIFGFPFAVQLTTNIMIVLGMVALFIIYTKAYKEIIHRTRDSDLDNNLPTAVTQRRDPSQEFCRSVLFILSALVACYTPYMLFTFIRYMGSPLTGVYMEFTSLCFVYANCSLNALIFLSLNREFKNYVVQLFRGRE